MTSWAWALIPPASVITVAVTWSVLRRRKDGTRRTLRDRLRTARAWWQVRVRRVPVRADGWLTRTEFTAWNGLKAAYGDTAGTGRVAEEEAMAEELMRGTEL